MGARVWVVMAVVIVVVIAGLAATALVAWPAVHLDRADAALTRVVLPGFAGRVTAVAVSTQAGEQVSVKLRQGNLWPLGKLAAGERLTVKLTVRRPTWIGWLVGHSAQSSFTIETPDTHLLSAWLTVKAGTRVSVAFTAPVTLISLPGSAPRQLTQPQTVVSLGVVASGVNSAGTIDVAAAARIWERLSAATRVTWFTQQPYPQLVMTPAATATLASSGQIRLTFSGPIEDVLGTRRPQLAPTTPGRWLVSDAHTLVFQPSGLGFGLAETVHVELPVAVHIAGQSGAKLTRTLTWQVGAGSTLRLDQLLAELGYLPLSFQPSSAPASDSAATELAAALSPPSGTFSWRYANTPAELRTLWKAGQANEISRGAVMMFEDRHGLTVDGLAGPKVWSALLSDALAGRRDTSGYSYVYVHRRQPQSLNLWHNGRLILSSPGNTGVPAAPTQLGTFAVFEHIPVGTMSGTNPDGSHYHDPGIRYISYFNGGDAIHSFNRASYGTPQSLGCVELPLAAAAKVWPYTPIGTLVTIEN